MTFRTKRVVATTAAVTVLALAGGVAAQFTTSTTSAPQQIGTGTVALALDDVAPMSWTQDISNLAAGDTIRRFVDLRNAGTIDLAGMQVSQTNTLGQLLVEPSDISVRMDICSVAWNTTTGTCAGTESLALNTSSVRQWAALIKDVQGFDAFKAGDSKHLRLTTTLASTAVNNVQNTNGTITYTFGAGQRAGMVFGDTGNSGITTPAPTGTPTTPAPTPTDVPTTAPTGTPTTSAPTTTAPTGTPTASAPEDAVANPVSNLSATPDQQKMRIAFTDTNAGKARYQLTYAPVTGGTAQTIDLAQGATTAEVSGLKQGVVYIFTLVSIVGDQQSAATANAALPMLAVTDFALSPSGTTALTASFTDTSGGSAAHELTYTDAPGPKTVTLNPGVTSYRVTGLQIATNYSFSVRAVQDQNSSASVSASATLPIADLGDLTLTPNVTAGSITASFVERNAGQLPYTLTYSTAGQQPVSVNLPAGSTSYTITGLSQGADYTFTLTAAKNGLSKTTSANTALSVPAPSALKVSSAGAAALKADFTDNSGAHASHVLTFTPESGAATTVTLPAGTTSYTATGLQIAQKYTVSVHALSSGVSSADITATATVPIANLGALRATTSAPYTDGAVHLSWTEANASQLGYTLTYAPTAGGAETSVNIPVGSTSYDLSGLPMGMGYTYTLTAAKGGLSQTTSTTLTIPVPSPTNLVVAKSGATAFTATFNDNSGGKAQHIVTLTPTDGSAPLSYTLNPGVTTVTVPNAKIAVTYSVEVIARLNGTDSLKASTEATLPINPLGALSLSTGSTAGSANFSFADTNAGQLEHVLTYVPSAGGTPVSITLAPGTTTKAITGLSLGVEYTFTLTATKNGLSQSISTTRTTPVPAPSDMTVTKSGNTSLTVSFTDNAAGQAPHELTYSYPGGTSTTVSVPAGASSYTIAGAQVGVIYTVSAKAVANGTSSPTITASGTILMNAPVVTKGTVTYNQIPITWTDTNYGQVAYRVLVTAQGQPTVTYNQDMGATSFVIPTDPSTQYSVQVRAVRGSTSSDAGQFDVLTPVAPPTTPVLTPMTASDISTTSVNVPLSGSSNVSTYNLRYSTDSGTTWTTVTGISSSLAKYNLTGLTASTKYTYALQAVNASGTSTWSASAIFTTSEAAAPVVIGAASFFDTFATAYNPLGGKPTGDGSSTWVGWGGSIKTTGGAAYANSNARSMAVVRTSSNNGSMYLGDADGFESVIVRGSNASNYILVGGAGTANRASIIQVENGVATTLASGSLAASSNIRVVAQGSTISIYKVTNSSTSIASATPVLTASTTFNQSDPGATYFGIGFTSSATTGYGIPDFTFDAL